MQLDTADFFLSGSDCLHDTQGSKTLVDPLRKTACFECIRRHPNSTALGPHAKPIAPTYML